MEMLIKFVQKRWQNYLNALLMLIVQVVLLALVETAKIPAMNLNHVYQMQNVLS
jgi:hypothetical protein